MEAASSSQQLVGAKIEYDVFLSFRGEDTRKNFVSHLYVALDKKGIRTFKDDRSLEKGKTIKEELFKAIEESHLAIIVLSKNYASSRWCLEELVQIIECNIKRKQTVIPIFYGVDESEKCNIIDRFAEAFAKREQADSKDGYLFIEEERVKSWKQAITNAIESDCWDVNKGVEQCGNEAECIEKIVEEIVSKLKIIKPSKTNTVSTCCRAEASLALLFEGDPSLTASPYAVHYFFFFSKLWKSIC